jgi:hypothetical protein
MSVKKPKKRPVKTTENRDTVRRTRMLQIVVIVFSIILILSMILSLTTQ